MDTRDLEREARVVDGRLLLHSDTLADDLEYVFRERLAGVECNVWHGFRLRDLPRIVDSRIRSLNVVQRPDDLSPIEEMDWLEELRLGGAGPINLSRHISLESLTLEWHKGLCLPPQMPALRKLGLWKLKARDITELPEAPGIEELRLVQGSLASLAGLERYVRLRRLELQYLRSLTDIAHFGGARELVAVTFDRCPAIADYGPLAEATSLREVCIFGSTKLASIGFVRGLPHLERLALVDSVVVDGDLAPALGIRTVQFADRRHYSHTRAQVQAAGEWAYRVKEGIPLSGLPDRSNDE